jgi:hypothetical protein
MRPWKGSTFGVGSEEEQMGGRWLTPLLGILWVCALAAGEWRLLHHEHSPGKPASTQADWPNGTRLPYQTGLFNLLVFAHPHCPCTSATLNELANLMATCRDRVAAQVIFVEPEGAGPNWKDTPLRRKAAAIPGVTVLSDEGGIEAQRFDARTSGQVFLYDPQGRLRFQGGITPSRGHEGDNTGKQAIIDIVVDGSQTDTKTNVFGCPLQEASFPSAKPLGYQP